MGGEGRGYNPAQSQSGRWSVAAKFWECERNVGVWGGEEGNEAFWEAKWSRSEGASYRTYRGSLPSPEPSEKAGDLPHVLRRLMASFGDTEQMGPGVSAHRQAAELLSQSSPGG